MSNFSFNMFRSLLNLAPAAPLALAFNCTPSAFQQHLPDNARVISTRSIPDGGTYEVSGNVAYPISPTGLRALCALEVNVTSSPTSAYTFGLFLPQDWNERFLAVGNSGYSGGINWIDMGAGVGYGFAIVSTDTGHNSESILVQSQCPGSNYITDYAHRHSLGWQLGLPRRRSTHRLGLPLSAWKRCYGQGSR